MSYRTHFQASIIFITPEGENEYVHEDEKTYNDKNE